MQLTDRVAEHLEPYRGQNLLVAVSGGLDSVALLNILLGLQETLDIKLIVAHIDHGLCRGSRKDAEFVAKLAAAYSLPFESTHLSLNPGGNVEARAREARYRWLEQLRKKKKAAAIITAHQADDQVETLLLHLTRGSGLTGLTGMRVVSGPIVRPLLDVPRKQLTRYVRRHRLKYRLDPTNKSLKIARNRVRRQVITALSRINPQLIETVSQSMRVLADEYGVLKHLAEDHLRRVTIKRLPGETKLSVSKLSRLPRGVRHLVWREALRDLQGDLVGFRLNHLENLDELLKRQTGSRIHLPHGLVAERSYQALRLLKPSAPIPPPKKVRLSVPGEATFGDVRLLAKPSGRSKDSIAIDAAVGDTLLIRPPKIGDRFKPSGMRGSKLVSDLLTDAKVPRDERPWVPVLTTLDGEIIWVVGYRADRRFAAKPKGTSVRLSVRPA